MIINESIKYPFKNKVWSSEKLMTRDLEKQAFEVHRFEKDKVWLFDNSDENGYNPALGYEVKSYPIRRMNGTISFIGNGPMI